MSDIDYRDMFENLSRMGANFYKAEDYKLSDKALKIDDETIASSSSLFTMVPWLATRLSYNGALIAELPEGTHLATDAAGKMLGTALSNESNKLVGQARFSMIQPKGADIVSLAFAVMSFVTGQYYMHMNSMDMGQVNGILKNLEGHIEAEKYSELCQENETLRNIAEDYKFIVLDEDRMKNSRLIVEDIVNNTSKNNEYYKRQIEGYAERFKASEKKDISTEKKLINLNSLSYKIVFNLYNHGIASFMYMMLYNIRNKEEIMIRKDRLEKKWDESIRLVDKTYHDVGMLIESKDFDKVIKQETLSVPGKAATHLLVPLPFNILVDKKATGKKVTNTKDGFKESVDQSWESFIKFKCEVSPIPMINNYVDALDQRKMLISTDDGYYIDVVDSANLNYEPILIENLA